MLDWSSDSWHFDSPVTVTAALLDTDEWLSPDPGPVLRGEVEVRKFHPAINRLLRTSKWYSAETKQRAKLLLHVVVTEAQARGWSVTAHDTEDHQGKKVLERVTLDTDYHSYEMWVSERDRVEAERRQRRLDKATELARVHHREGERHKVLLKRVEAWKERQAIEEYLAALEGVPEAEAWLRWCRERLNKTSPLGGTDLPMETPFDEHENRGLIAAFEQRLPEDESQW